MEQTPTFVKGAGSWERFKENVIESKNQQFDPKVLKENVLHPDSNNTRSKFDKPSTVQFLN